jgi:hypothetical protein
MASIPHAGTYEKYPMNGAHRIARRTIVDGLLFVCHWVLSGPTPKGNPEAINRTGAGVRRDQMPARNDVFGYNPPR